MSTDPRSPNRRALDEALAATTLVDHHVHSALAENLDRTAFETTITEAPAPLPAPATQFDSQVGFAIRRWCAPLLDLAPHATAEDYLARRTELGHLEVNQRLLRASGVERYLIDTGYQADALATNARFAELAGAEVHEIVRLEAVAEQLVVDRPESVDDFAAAYRAALREATRSAAGVKSIVAYRHGFHFDPERPDDAVVLTAARRWLDGTPVGTDPRLDDPVLLRFLLWSAVDLGLPIQLHTGYGDPDLDLRLTDPLLLKSFLEKTLAVGGPPVMLLHCYPFHRECGFLAQVYPHVYLDVGLAVNYVGARATEIVAESLELAPFSRVLFSSDAWGPSELHYLGAHLWRRATAATLAGFVDADEWSLDEAVRVARMVGRDNARAVYGLGGMT